jgi:arylsulfatase A-like enzyme
MKTRRADGSQDARRWLALVALLAIGAAAGIIGFLGRRMPELSRAWRSGHALQLSHRMRAEEVLTNLVATFDRAIVERESPESPVHLARIRPGNKWRFQQRDRRVIVATPPSSMRVRARIPPDAVLRFGIGVERARRVEEPVRGIRFVVRVDGRERFAQLVNPVRSRLDRRWFDVRVDLEADEDRDAEITFETEALGTGDRLAGVPGWSHVRIVRETWRDRQPASASAPSVLVLLVDTLRADGLGCYGADPSPTPVVDALAAQGMLFEQVVSQSSWTLPSVASIFTGLHPRSHGVIGSYFTRGAKPETVEAGDPGYLPDQLRTLAEHAQAAGITTMGLSTNPLVSRGTNLARGFETFIEIGREKRVGRAPAAEVNDVFLEWLQRNRGLRFFAYLHYMDVHGPYKPPDGHRPRPSRDLRRSVVRGEVRQIEDDIAKRGEPPLTAAELQYLRALYDGQIRYWDAELGRLLRGLLAAGVRETTALVITSDHGEQFMEHGRLKHGVNLYEELIRVPLVIHGPGIERRRIAEQAQGIDVFPTIAALLDLPPPALPGENLLALRGTRPAIAETRWGFGPDGASTALVALRTEGWKLIHAPALDHFELYDLHHDPREQDDRMSGAPEGEALARQLVRWETTAPRPPPRAGRDPEFHERLRALGYVE